MGRVRSAIVGTGGIAGAHVAALRSEADRAELVAAADVDLSRVEEFCSAHDIPRSYGDVDALLAAEEPGLVHVCTPPGTHRDLILRCLEAGAWVYCEKPLCASLREMDEIEAAEKRTGRYCAGVLQWRSGSGAARLKNLVEAGELGRPLVGLCQTTWYRDHAYYAVPWRGRWETELGGVSMGHGIHAMDLFLWTMGEWREVDARIGTLDREIEVEDVSMAIVTFENGAMGNVTNSVLSPRQESYLRLDLQKATVELRHLYGYTNESWTYTGLPDVPPEDPARWRGTPSEAPPSQTTQLGGLLDAMEKGERPPTSGPEARRTLEFLASLYKSALTGKNVGRGTIGKHDPFYDRMNGGMGLGRRAS